MNLHQSKLESQEQRADEHHTNTVSKELLALLRDQNNLIDRQQRENVELRLKVETLVWAIAELRAEQAGVIATPVSTGGWSPEFPPKKCLECGVLFIPNSGRQVKCRRPECPSSKGRRRKPAKLANDN
jgi:hypothetical protein